MTALPPYPEQKRGRRALARTGRLVVALLCLAFAAAAPARAAEPVHTTVKVSKEDGFSRMLFRFDQEVVTKVMTNNLIMIVNFARPVDVAVDTLNAAAPDLISAARRDPDGMAVRIALRHARAFGFSCRGFEGRGCGHLEPRLGRLAISHPCKGRAVRNGVE